MATWVTVRPGYYILDTGSAYEIGSLSLKPCLVGVIDLTNNFTATRSNVDVVNWNFTVTFKVLFLFLCVLSNLLTSNNLETHYS